MAYFVSLGGVRLPVTPSTITMKSKNQNKTYTLINGQEINIPKSPGLVKITFGALFPAVKYPFTAYRGGTFRHPVYYREKLEKWKAHCKPIKLVIQRGSPANFKTTVQVTLEEYEIVEDADKYGADTYANITLLQYEPFGTKVVKFKNNKKKKVATVTTKRDTSKKKAVTSYTVKSGDTLWSIAKRFLGDGSRDRDLYTLNKATIEAAAKKHGRASSSKGWWIYPGTKLKLPSA